MGLGRQSFHSPFEEQPALRREWLAEFQARAYSCGFSGRVFAAVFEPESRSFAVVSALDDEELEPFMLPQLPHECLDRLTGGQEITLPGSAWPAAAEHSVVMFPLRRGGLLQGAACIESISPDPSPDQLQVLREACSRALQEFDGVVDGPGAWPQAGLQAAWARVLELHARNELKSRILANLLHELRSPLVAVRGYTRMVLEGRGGPVSTTQQEYLNVVAESANRLVKAVNHAAQLDADELRLAPWDPVQLWRAAVERIRPAAHAKGVRICERMPEARCEIVMDGRRIAQVIEALLENAVKYSVNNADIIGEIEFGEEENVFLKISDSGPGIPPGLMEKMFDRYYQSESALAGEEADVRLPLVYDIVRLHGGRLSVNSNAGEGCTFVVELPAIRVKDAQEGLSSNEQASGSGSR